MTTRVFGGLSGKARRVHHRGHANRRFEERLIAEYMEAGERSERLAHDAPIRSRREFMPTMLVEADMTDGGKESQLELAWDQRTDVDDGRSANRRVVWSTGSDAEDAEQAVALIKVPSSGGVHVNIEHDDTAVSQTRADASRSPVDGSTGDASVQSPEPRVLRIPRRAVASMPIGWSQSPVAEPRARLSLRGFVRGCAIGGVAAAVVLTVLSVALG